MKSGASKKQSSTKSAVLETTIERRDIDEPEQSETDEPLTGSSGKSSDADLSEDVPKDEGDFSEGGSDFDIDDDSDEDDEDIEEEQDEKQASEESSDLSEDSEGEEESEEETPIEQPTTTVSEPPAKVTVQATEAQAAKPTTVTTIAPTRVIALPGRRKPAACVTATTNTTSKYTVLKAATSSELDDALTKEQGEPDEMYELRTKLAHRLLKGNAGLSVSELIDNSRLIAQKLKYGVTYDVNVEKQLVCLLTN